MRRIRPSVSRIRLVTVLISIAVACFALIAPVQTIGLTRASSPSSNGCTSLALAQRAWAAGATVNSSQAIATATTSTVYQSYVRGFAAGTSISFGSIFDLWNDNQTTCIPELESVNVVFQTQTSNDDVANLVVTEPVTLQTVTGGQFYDSPTAGVQDATVSHALGIWNGYEYPTSNGPYGQWYVPSATAPTSQCDNTECTFSIWVGQTNTSNGGSPHQGIAQTGTDVNVLCVWNGIAWNCDVTDEAWYEFFPKDSVNCFGVAPNNVMDGFSTYISGEYYLDLEDKNNSKACTENQAISGMGPPSYAEWIGEDPVVGSGNPPLPGFAQFRFDGIAASPVFNLVTGSFQQNGNYPTVQEGPMSYGNPPCQNTYGDSCFTMWYS
jgi:Peptidase A4 family